VVVSILLHVLVGLAFVTAVTFALGHAVSWWVGGMLGGFGAVAVLLLGGFMLQALPKRMPWEKPR